MPTATRSAAAAKAPAPRPRAGTDIHRGRWLLALTMILAVAAVVAPTGASASTRQLSLIQDDRELLGQTPADPATVMREIKELGVDVVRTNVIFNKVYREPAQRTKPSGFTTSDPNEALYDWGRTDRLVDLARQNGIKVLMTVTGPGPHWSTTTPGKCRAVPCTLNPKPDEFGGFAAAAAKRYKGKVTYYSIYNEPNLVDWLRPQMRKSKLGTIFEEGKAYRKLWQAGYKSIARFDSARRNHVLFGEVAAIGEPLPLMYTALCLTPQGKPMSAKLRKVYDCPARPGRLNVGGFAIHPYNFGGFGSPQSKTNRTSALPLAYLPRLTRLIDTAKKRGRISRKAPIFVTEFGFQTNPPDKISSINPLEQAQYINESERLFYGNPRVATYGQYELADVPEADQFNSGLRFAPEKGRGLKPSYNAFRVPLVVTKRKSKLVEVWGANRTARRKGSSVAIQVRRGNGSFKTVRTVRTGSGGYFRVAVKRSSSSSFSWRLSAKTPAGETITSRIAKPRSALRYFKK